MESIPVSHQRLWHYAGTRVLRLKPWNWDTSIKWSGSNNVPLWCSLVADNYSNLVSKTFKIKDLIIWFYVSMLSNVNNLSLFILGIEDSGSAPVVIPSSHVPLAHHGNTLWQLQLGPIIASPAIHASCACTCVYNEIIINHLFWYAKGVIIIISIINTMIIIFKGLQSTGSLLDVRRHMQTSLLVCFYACYEILLDPTMISSDNQKVIIEELMSMSLHQPLVS